MPGISAGRGVDRDQIEGNPEENELQHRKNEGGKDGQELRAKVEITLEEEAMEEIKERDENAGEGSDNEEDDDLIVKTELEGKVEEDGKEPEGIFCEMSYEIWRDFEDVICEVVEYEESKNAEREDVREGVAGERDTMEVEADEKEWEERGEPEAMETERTPREAVRVPGDKEEAIIETEVEIEDLQEWIDSSWSEEKHQDQEMQQDPERSRVASLVEVGSKEGNADILETHAGEEGEKMPEHKEEEKEDGPKEEEEKSTGGGPTPMSIKGKDGKMKEVETDVKEKREGGCGDSDGRPETGIGSVLVISTHKPAKVYQVRAVPVVPPKPQHCRLTALGLRQLQQERERADADGARENSPKKPDSDKEKGIEGKTGREGLCPGEIEVRQGEDEIRGRKGGGERGERKRDGDKGGIRDMVKITPISMCFDEAVAMATMKRGREKESSGRERLRGYDI